MPDTHTASLMDVNRPWPKSEDAGPIPEFLNRAPLMAEQQEPAAVTTNNDLDVLASSIRGRLQVNTLENLCECILHVPEAIAHKEIEVPRTRCARSLSRSARRDDACALLDAVAQVLDLENCDARKLHAEIENFRSEAEDVYFPGWRG